MTSEDNLIRPMTVEEIATYFSVHTATIYRWKKDGMPCIGNSKSIRFDIEEVKQWMKEKRR